MSLKVAVIGCGSRGRGHIRILTEFPDVELVAVCDPVDTSLQKIIDEYSNITGYDNLETMLDQVCPDAVWVAPPAHLNHLLAQPCLERGIHTLMEKPPGLNLEQAQQLLEIANKTKAKTMVGWNRRFNGFISEARNRIAKNGPIVQVVGEFHKNVKQLISTGKFSDSIYDVMLLESPIHAIDTVRFLAGGEVVEVHSVVKRATSDYRDVHGATIVFDSNCFVHLISNYTAGSRLERYEIHGDGISAYLQGVSEGKICQNEKAIDLPVPEKDSTWLQNRYFVDQVQSDSPIELPAANLQEGVKTMDLAIQILDGTRE